MRSPSPSSSSSDPESSVPQVSAKTSKKTKDKGKNKAAANGKNEGTDSNWAYQPPQGTVLVEDDVDAGEFDWDVIKQNEDLELWLIRVPDSVKPKHLDNLKLEVPSSSKTARIGSLKRKLATYDMWNVGDDVDQQPVGGEEVKGLSCLLPRKGRKGRLYPAPKSITRHLVMSAQAVVPAALETEEGTPKYKNPPRQCYPKDVLTHRFVPFNSIRNATTEDVTMGDVEEAPKKAKVEAVGDAPAVEGKKPKGKKRKGDGDAEAPTQKKAKKSKTAAS
ncbi:hypothetical protein BDQ12DRAFT_639357 [Crucibulum laeve]|uniref:DNA-directed RNA polymerase I subunit RPA34.5-domain-containing protein n=1 Tax=Crucibulum laeve TaxID=68775 RepID=A0A5C3LFS8_9AGAR|nr:hypothetical protein BDQ12DRAFT_639357 [Crucibulum laeve]